METLTEESSLKNLITEENTSTKTPSLNEEDSGSPRPNKKNSGEFGGDSPSHSNDMREKEPSEKENGMANGKKNGYANGKENGSNVYGILKKKVEITTIPDDVSKENERWKQNYVAVIAARQNSIEKKSREKVSNGTTKSRTKSTAENDENNDSLMVRKVSQIFDEVFKEARGTWSYKFEYFVACIGMPIAFSSMWRLPSLISQYGGGAFLFVYVLMTLLIGVPFYFMEAALAQFAQLGVVQVWRCIPIMQGVGVGMLVLSLITAIYNSQIVAYVVHYFFASFINTDGLVMWGECRPFWPNCYDATVSNICPTFNIPDADCSRVLISSSRFYWEQKVLRLTDLGEVGRTGPIPWELALCLVFVWLTVFFVLIKGIKSCGKVAIVTGFAPIVILIALLIKSLLLEGGSQGVEYFYDPQWGRLSEAVVWQKAAEQVLFSLAVVYGCVLTFSSYKSIKSTVEVSPLILVVLNLAISILAATTVFAMLGVLAYTLGFEDPRRILVSEDYGIEILFTRLPEAIAKRFFVPHAWSVVYFFMLLCFGIHSQFALVEVALTTVYDAVPGTRKRKYLVGLCLVVPLFLLSLPLSASTGLHIHQIIETSIIGPNVILLAIFEILSIQLLYGVRRFCNDLRIIMKREVSIFWKVCWVFVAPVTLIIIFVFAAIDWRRMIFANRRDDKGWTLILSWTLSLLPLAMIPLTFIFTIFYKICKREPICQPSVIWGPGCPRLTERLSEYRSRNILGSDNDAFN